MDVEDHVASGVADLGVGMAGGVVDEISYFLHGGFSRFGLGRGDGAERDENEQVDVNGVI